MEFDESLAPKSRKIICIGVPKKLMDRIVAKEYFRQFGRVLRVILRPNSCSIILEFDCTENAQRAMLEGGDYMGQEFTINWFAAVKKKRIKKDPDPEWVPDPEVQAELAAMAGQGTLKRDYNLRPEGMMVDEDEPPAPPKKILKRSWKSETIKKLKAKAKATSSKSKSGSFKAWTLEQLELLKILRQPAFTAEEKLKVLETRDKLIRLQTAKPTDLRNTTRMVGTCLDMCPEKERLLRETQHQIALYEQDATGKGMNPHLAIKQYSRSSADQEVPLPHDLRPVSVLQLTMSYLTYKIMNLCDTPDVNLGEWYHFLWDRSRSIRKDITQQELCCQGSVALLEQCARFHIHCSARFAGEDLSIFDQKINTENLTKCLQTLKYMYHDLSIKGENCANEAEFRAYVILLNLNDGNFMWEVQQLKPEIQKSSEVKFALTVYSAVDKNNFVKFFKLVRSTNYLNACVLLRYFVQIRTRALLAILKCYSPRSPYTQFPLNEFINLLGFEDAESALDFITCHGLLLNPEQTHVVLDRKNFQLPEIPYPLDRAVQMVESKRTSSVGETVYGNRTPPKDHLNYVPHNSFDSKGRFIIKGIMEDLTKEAERTLIPKESDEPDSSKPSVKSQKRASQPPEPPPKSLFTAAVEQIKTPDQSKSLWSFKSEANLFKREEKPAVPFKSLFAPPLPTKPATAENIFAKAAKSIFGEQATAKMDATGSVFNTFKFMKPDMPPPHVKDPKEEERRAKQEELRLFREREERLRIEIEKTKRREEEVYREQEARRRLEKERKERERLEKERQERERLERERQEQERREKERLQHEKAEREKRERKRRLEIEKQKKIEEQRLKAVLLEKRRHREVKRAVAELMNDLLDKVEENVRANRLNEISAAMYKRKMRLFVEKWRLKCISNKRKREAMDQNPIWLPARTCEEEAKELFTSSQNMTLHNSKRYKCGKSAEPLLPTSEKVPKLNIPLLYSEIATSTSHTCQRFLKEIFWKVTVSLPDCREFKRGLHKVEEVFMEYFQWKDRYGSSSIMDHYVAESRFNYCFEKKQGVHKADANSNGFLFVTDRPNALFMRRVVETFKDFPRAVSAPVAVVFVNCRDRLDDFQLGNRHIAKLKHVTCDFSVVSLAAAVEESLVFLARSVLKPPPLELDCLKSFFDAYLVTELWRRIASYATWNSRYKACLKSPTVIVGLYNEAVDRLKRIIFDRSCLEYATFPDEFEKLLSEKFPQSLPCDYRYFPSFWKTDAYNLLLLKLTDSFKLPEYRYSWPPDSAEQLERDILEYCSETFQDPEKPFYKVMAAILRDFNALENYHRVKNVLWTDVVEVIALEKLNEVDVSLEKTVFHSKSMFQEFVVIYKKAALEAYAAEEWFYLKHPLVEAELKKHQTREQRPIAAPMLHIDLEELENSVKEDQLDEAEKERRSTDIQQLLDSIADLEDSIQVHKRICVISQDCLRKALRN